MNDRIEQAIKSLQKSTFRSKFKLSNKDRQYIQDKSIEAIGQHAIDFNKTRIAPEYPKNDGNQTPMKGHPFCLGF
ncbi:MAG: DUF4186 family protein [Desulfobulbaceae bacterium]|nr:DUF4186 family protein [Desulfobulbaceae bacterium]